MGRGLVDAVIAYLDTHVVIWLATNKSRKLSARARKLIESADLLISPSVFVELEILREVGKVVVGARDILRKLESEIGLRQCTLPFTTIADVAVDEKWTRDPFDRLIVANAKANGFAFLISADERIRETYPRAVW